MFQQKFGIAATVCFLLASGDSPAQTKVHTESTTKQTWPGPDTKVKTEAVVGTVKEYEAGRKIKVSGPRDRVYSFDLDKAVRVDGVVTVGQMAQVEWTKENGRERVTVIAPFALGIRSSVVKSRPVASTAGHDVHRKSEKTVHQPGPDVTTKTELVIGTVRQYEPGRKIKVTGPNGKDVSFDLDRDVTLNGRVAVGQRVKVEYTKGDLGDHVTVVSLVKGTKRP